jgi:hypothetical protein
MFYEHVLIYSITVIQYIHQSILIAIHVVAGGLVGIADDVVHTKKKLIIILVAVQHIRLIMLQSAALHSVELIHTAFPYVAPHV